ncbi:adenylosuccinate lyase family protein [Fodinicurvata sp. EGI_FJ10296]|uniref:class-II fumarase/aspartase family protein n=1 Tax=Fodinicurvata sp. EGI_FJ10296 TaxID=3231908 RepID=UPI003454A497
MALFDAIYLSDEMRGIFSAEATAQAWLDVEAALARAQAEIGMIPASAAAAITRAARTSDLDLAKLDADTRALGWPILPLVHQLSDRCGDDAGGYVHWGATTQDIMDTGLVLQLRAAWTVIDRDLGAIQEILIDLAQRHRSTLMAGRTHGQHALPLTFGFKAAVWLDEMTRHRHRMAESRSRVLTLQFGGAVGTLASLGDDGLAVRAALARELGLSEPVISWHVSRDALAEAYGLAAAAATTAEKIAQEIWLLMKTEIGELAEPAIPGRGGSSTMPQKRNPVTCELVATCAAAARRDAAASVESMRHDHERGMGPAHQEWYLTPTAIPRAGTALSLIKSVLADLIVDADRMRANLDITQGLLLAEAVMMELAQRTGRQKAHVLMKDVCHRAIAENRPLYDVMAETTAVTDVLTPDALGACLDPANYLGTADAMIDRAIAAARRPIPHKAHQNNMEA